MMAGSGLPLTKKRVGATVLLRGGTVILLQFAVVTGTFSFDGCIQTVPPNAYLVWRAAQSSQIEVMILGMFLAMYNPEFAVQVTVAPAASHRIQRLVGVLACNSRKRCSGAANEDSMV
jgi:hypothetical protein